MGSILNPMHGGDQGEAAKSLGADSAMLNEIEANKEKEVEQKKFRMIFLLSSMLIVFYVSGSGVYSLFAENRAHSLNHEIRDLDAHSPNPFHNFFCKGIKTSRACY